MNVQHVTFASASQNQLKPNSPPQGVRYGLSRAGDAWQSYLNAVRNGTDCFECIEEARAAQAQNKPKAKSKTLSENPFNRPLVAFLNQAFPPPY